ncbi:MAG: glycosyltransferase family 4 protein [Saprospiraceae bacterium]|nr:glycosyltransferase family 4 protein [Saprospiraceae bacterium]
MRIVFLGDCITNQKAGIHYYAINLIRYIIKKYPEHQYCVVLTRLLPELSVEQIIVPVSKWIPFHLRLRQIFTIPSLLNKLQPDLVIELAHFGPFNLRSSIKRVTVIHDLTPITHPKLHPWSSVITHRFLMQKILTRATFIIANSDFTRDQIVSYFGKFDDKICIAYPFVHSFERNDLVPVGHDSKNPYFLTVGTLEPRKNHVTILKAFEIFCQYDSEYSLVIVGGEGWKNYRFKKALSVSPIKNRVILTGYLTRHELLIRYSQARAFIFASVVEGFGLPMLEASQFGLPLILAENASLPPWFRDTGLLFKPADVNTLSLHMQHLASKPDLHRTYSHRSKEAYSNYQKVQGQIDRIFVENPMID